MLILIAADADHVVADVTAALGGPDVHFLVCREGRDVSRIAGRQTIDLAVLDLQIGSMGAMAVTMGLRLDETAGRLPHVPVIMLLDRTADVHLARRSAAEAWLVKPIDPLRLARTARDVLNPPTPSVPVADPVPADLAEGAEPAHAG